MRSQLHRPLILCGLFPQLRIQKHRYIHVWIVASIIIAGPKDPEPRVEGLQSPAATATDSSDRVFVADRGAKTVHIFDFVHGKYGLLEGGKGHLGIPIALAADGQDNLYVTDELSRTILVYDSTGKFRRTLGKLSEEESYFESPAGIAIDNATGHIYVCDMIGTWSLCSTTAAGWSPRPGNAEAGTVPATSNFPPRRSFMMVSCSYSTPATPESRFLILRCISVEPLIYPTLMAALVWRSTIKAIFMSAIPSSIRLKFSPVLAVRCTGLI
jgi:hypothetical protein